MEKTVIEQAAGIVFPEMMDTNDLVALAGANGYRITHATVQFFRGAGQGPQVHMVCKKPFFLRYQVLEWLASESGQRFNIAKNIADLQAYAAAAAAAVAAKAAPQAPSAPTAAPAAPALPEVAAPAQTPPAPAKRIRERAA